MQLGTESLADRDRAILEVERSWWLSYGSKDEAIRAELTISPSTYYRLLHELIDRDDARRFDPMVVLRAQRARAARRRARHQGKTVGSPPPRPSRGS